MATITVRNVEKRVAFLKPPFSCRQSNDVLLDLVLWARGDR
jgi:hypothetical protein